MRPCPGRKPTWRVAAGPATIRDRRNGQNFRRPGHGRLPRGDAGCGPVTEKLACLRVYSFMAPIGSPLGEGLAMSRNFGLGALLWLLSGASVLAQKTSNVSYAYDEVGQLVGSVDANGEAKAYTYDAAGHLVSVEKMVASGPVDIFFLGPNRILLTPSQNPRVTIYGVGFSSVPAENQVAINGAPAVVESLS